MYTMYVFVPRQSCMLLKVLGTFARHRYWATRLLDFHYHHAVSLYIACKHKTTRTKHILKHIARQIRSSKSTNAQQTRKHKHTTSHHATLSTASLCSFAVPAYGFTLTRRNKATQTCLGFTLRTKTKTMQEGFTTISLTKKETRDV